MQRIVYIFFQLDAFIPILPSKYFQLDAFFPNFHVVFMNIQDFFRKSSEILHYIIDNF